MEGKEKKERYRRQGRKKEKENQQGKKTSRIESKSRAQDKYTWKLLVLALVMGLLAGVVGTALTAQIFVKPGPQGEQGAQGPEGETGQQGQQGPQGEQGRQGETGSQGPQGIAGVNGTDAILQMLQNRNDTQVDTGSYTAMQWYNMSDFDSLMEITINVQQNSKIFVQFSGSHSLNSPASVWVRIVVDNNFNSSRYICAMETPASGIDKMAGHIEFLTDSLNAGSHTINVQFLKELGSPGILDRVLTVMEIASQ